MLIGFRVDAAKHIGTGHLQRCLTLAQCLIKHGHECFFFCRNFDPKYYADIERSDSSLVLIGSGQADSSILDKNWLRVSVENDLSDFLCALKKSPIDICIVDHYFLDKEWESKVSKYIKKIVVIDDLANREHDCDILIDQNYLPLYEQRYDDLVPKQTKKLLGPSFVLLREEFLKLRKEKQKPIFDAEEQILINFGGVGNYLLLSKVIEAINIFQKQSFYIVTGRLEPHQFLELERSVSYPKVKIVETVSNMASLMSQSQYAIGACGSTVWERFCLGLNSGLVEMAENQAPLLNYLTKMNLIDNLGNVNFLTTDDILKLLQNLDLTDAKYSHRKTAIMSLIDGKGTQRVVEMILEVANV